MSMRPRALSCAIALCLLPFAAGCTAPAAEEPTEQPGSEFANPTDIPETNMQPTAPADKPTAPPTLEERAAKKVADMTLEQKVAQMFIVRPESVTGVETVTQAGETTREALHTYPVGGIVYFQKNLLDADQTRDMIANSQEYAEDACGLPLFIGVDEEGGTVSRIGGNPGFGIENVGDMAAVGATGDAAQAKAVATSIGAYLHDLGFNLDFAPDSDICGDPAVDVMALRSFGSDPARVSEMVTAQVEGFAEAGMLCCVKHFPGIGGVLGDSHEGAIVSNKTLDELRSWELVPFQAAIAADVPFVMVGHLTAPAATGSDLPASINPAIVTDLLRGELGYSGIIITDSMGMGAVDGFCTPDQVGVAAIEAGVDVVLMPADFPAAYQGVLDAVHDGRLTEDRLDESAVRIVAAKLVLAEE